MTILYLAALAICALLYFAAPKRKWLWSEPRVRVFVNGVEYRDSCCEYKISAVVEWTTADFTTPLDIGPKDKMVFTYKEPHEFSR